jgi:hypothetical protein
MIKAIAKSILDILPAGASRKLRAINRDRIRSKVIQKWRDEGGHLPPPHEVKQAVILEYQKQFGIRTLVETGTYYGDMVMAQKDNFDRIYSVELGMDLWAGAQKRFKSWPHIEILQGDSGKVLINLMSKLSGPALFWLDGHYSSGVTALGELVSPVFEEVNAILGNPTIPHVLLIDDARLFRGDGDYPTIEALEKHVLSKNLAYGMQVKDDVIRFAIKK